MPWKPGDYMTKMIRLSLVLFGGITALVLGAGLLLAQKDDQASSWNAESKRVLADAVERLQAAVPEQNWADEVQSVLTDVEKRLKASASGTLRAGGIQNTLSETARHLKAISATGTERDDQVLTIFENTWEVLKAIGAEQGNHEAASSLQVNVPKITAIRGGYYAEFGGLTEIGAIKLGGPITGAYEIYFDARMDDTGTTARAADDPEFLLVLADYWIVRGKPERAIPLYELGLEKDPENFLFLNNLALIVSSAAKDHDRALNIIDGALKERADNVTLLDTKGLILMNAKRFDEAGQVLQRAVELSCQKPLCVMHYAYALDLQGQQSSAREWFNKVFSVLETSAPTFLKDDKRMFDYLKDAHTGSPIY